MNTAKPLDVTESYCQGPKEAYDIIDKLIQEKGTELGFLTNIPLKVVMRKKNKSRGGKSILGSIKVSSE